MGETTYADTDSCCLASWHSRLVQHVLHRRFLGGCSGLYAAALSRYVILCDSHGQQALNGSVLLSDGIPNLATVFLR